ncbi:TspO/MBR family protein [Roseiconus nitratireducens]|uniref:TspO/MBR family protein n=1 Tax=Roseiconus nitratireducens TaxID=2605748 RepID=UPI001F1CDB13|nr:TspO/MBR family protein [Roseiconus nitratireducens]
MKKRTQWIGLVVWIVICLGAGGLGAIATTPEIAGWYADLRKPSWNPPDAVFGPVWTTLYLAMAIAVWLVWKDTGFRGRRLPLALFVVQLLLNVAWSWIFFGFHLPGWAFAEILMLWLAIALTLTSFWTVSQVAGALMIPYLAWVTFASALNFAIWRLNAGT